MSFAADAGRAAGPARRQTRNWSNKTDHNHTLTPRARRAHSEVASQEQPPSAAVSRLGSDSAFDRFLAALSVETARRVRPSELAPKRPDHRALDSLLTATPTIRADRDRTAADRSTLRHHAEASLHDQAASKPTRPAPAGLRPPRP